MSNDEGIPQEVLQQMELALKPIIAGKQLTPGLLIKLMATVEYFSIRIRQQGHKFPPLTLVFLERFGRIYLVRKDLEHEGIQRLIQNMIREYPAVTIPELVIAIKRGFPHYKPDDVGQEGDRVLKIVQRPKSKIILPGH